MLYIDVGEEVLLLDEEEKVSIFVFPSFFFSLLIK
jgi:hypothetical protein